MGEPSPRTHASHVCGGPARAVLTTRVDDPFWSPRIDTCLRATLPHVVAMCHESGRVANLRRAAGLDDGPHEGHRYGDSDLFKIVEGLAWATGRSGEHGELAAHLAELSALIAAAQEADGYLYTARTVAEARGTSAELDPTMVGTERWSALEESHELYNLGHLIDAAATDIAVRGRPSPLGAVADRVVDLVSREFGEGGRATPPGHQGIELALIRLFDVTGELALLDLSSRLLDLRGHHDVRPSHGERFQDHAPVLDQHEAEGHAVRLGYMATAMAELGARTGRREYVDASARLFHDVISCKLYVTGGIGRRNRDEAVGAPFDLADEDAYAETCAAIGLAMWADALCRATGSARYGDVTERALYNGLAVGSDLDGRSFHYPNPLSYRLDAYRPRHPWFQTACCPSNIARMLPSLHRFVVAQRDHDVWINQLIGASTSLTTAQGPVDITIRSAVPHSGRVSVLVHAPTPVAMRLRVRPPSWVHSTPFPSTLYRFADGETLPIAVDGEPHAIGDDGYLLFDRTWHGTATIEFDFPLAPRRIVADHRVTALADRHSISLGPLTYSAESIDSSEDAISEAMVMDAPITVAPAGTSTVIGNVPGVTLGDLPLIPFAVRSNRGPAALRTWFATRPG